MPLIIKRFVTEEYEPGKWRIVCDICDTIEEGFSSQEDVSRVRLVHDQWWHHGGPTIRW